MSNRKQARKQGLKSQDNEISWSTFSGARVIFSSQKLEVGRHHFRSDFDDASNHNFLRLVGLNHYFWGRGKKNDLDG